MVWIYRLSVVFVCKQEAGKFLNVKSFVLVAESFGNTDLVCVFFNNI